MIRRLLARAVSSGVRQQRARMLAYRAAATQLRQALRRSRRRNGRLAHDLLDLEDEVARLAADSAAAAAELALARAELSATGARYIQLSAHHARYRLAAEQQIRDLSALLNQHEGIQPPPASRQEPVL